MHQKILSRLLHSKLKKIQALFKDLHRNLRTFQGKMEFKDFSRTSPKIQGLFKTVRTLLKEKCSRLFKVQYSKPTRKKGNKNKIKGKQKKSQGKRMEVNCKRATETILHLSKNRMM